MIVLEKKKKYGGKLMNTMINIYVYVLDTLADWEIGHVSAELNSKRFFKKDAQQLVVKRVSFSKEPITTMGGMKIVPDCLIGDIVMKESSVLLLPGADTWKDPKHTAIIEKANELLSIGGTVCAICGATVALANYGILDNRPHTSNGAGFLDMFCPSYKGQSYYVNQPSVVDYNLITASCTGSLLWAKQIIEHLGVFQKDTLTAWYNYFSTGEARYFFEMMGTL